VSNAREVVRANSLHGSVSVPGDKSGSHRALMLSALASGTSTIEGLSPGLDVAATSTIMVQLGATRLDEGSTVTIDGPEHGLQSSSHELDCGNSGTSMRLLAGLVSGVNGVHALVGDESLSKRPMDRVAIPLNLMGATISGQGQQMTAPLRVEGSSTLRAIAYDVPVASAQVKSAILFAGLVASGPTSVHEDVLTRTTTEDMLRQAGLSVRSVTDEDGCTVTLTPGRPRPTSWRIPGDPSQAAFFAVLGAIHDCAVVEIKRIDASPQRIGFLGVLERMGAGIALVDDEGAITLSIQSSELGATEIHAHEIPSVDEVPILAVAAAAASGVSGFFDMGELRLKESDRFAGSMELARKLGCRVWDEGDDFFIEGLGSARAFQPFSVDAGLDHRMVMASAVAGCAGEGCTIGGADTVSSSYPHFFDDLAGLS
jgi:3-phosphoshikimate 1-carboxyvinyltransferase